MFFVISAIFTTFLKIFNMKLCLLGCCVLFLLMSFNWATFELDANLTNLKNALPKGWQLMIADDTLKIENPDPVWQLNSNFINAPVDAYQDNEENAKRILTHGKKTTAHFYFLLKPRKTITKVEKKTANYFSANYALFFIEGAGFDNAYARCYPWHIENEATMIYNVILRNHLIVVTGPVYPEVSNAAP